MRHFTLILSAAAAAALMAAGCHEKPEGGEGSVSLHSDVEMTLPAAATDTTISFSATADWTASAEGGEWLSISPASGEAGEIAATLSASANNEAEARTATVRITCGTDEVTVTVTQEGAEGENPDEPSEPEGPDDAGLVKSVNIWRSKYESSDYYEFKYDDMGRVSEIQREYIYDGYGSDVVPIHVAYEDGKVSLTFDFYDDEGERDYLHCTAETDGNGRAVMTTEQYKGLSPAYMTPHCSSAGYLESIDWDEDEDHYFHEFEWSDGNIASITYTDIIVSGNIIETHETRDFYYTDEPMNTESNLDINWLLKQGHAAFYDMGVQFFGVMGMLGERDAYYALPGYTYDPVPATNPSNIKQIPEDDLGTEYTEPVTREYCDYAAAEYECSVTDGRLTGISASFPVYDITYECTSKYTAVSSEPIFEEDGVKYYDAILEYVDVKELSREQTGTDKYEVTVTYY